jgi:hypothetical protein
MNWKCPQCGSDDNEENSRRCTCGYELDDNNPSTVQWVQPQIVSSGPEPYPASQATKNTTKQKIGNALYIFSIAMIFIIICLIPTKWSPSYNIIYLIISAAAFINTTSSLLTDDIGIRGYGIVNRVEKPGLFWFAFILQTFFAVALLLIAIFPNK